MGTGDLGVRVDNGHPPSGRTFPLSSRQTLLGAPLSNTDICPLSELSGPHRLRRARDAEHPIYRA